MLGNEFSELAEVDNWRGVEKEGVGVEETCSCVTSAWS